MKRFDQRQGFLVSAVIHLALLLMLIAYPPTGRRLPQRIDVSKLERKDLVFLPPPAVLRQLLPPPPAARKAKPEPVPTPPAETKPPEKKDRISIGPPTDLRTRGPLILRREDDLTKVPKGQMVTPPPAPTPQPPAVVARRDGGAPEVPGREGLRLPPGMLGSNPSGAEGRRGRPGTDSIEQSMQRAVESATRHMQADARLGLPTGTGQNIGGLMFDPQGADFTLWTNRFKDEVYRNWILPQAYLWGAVHGHVDFEFVVERDGTMSTLRLLKSSGTASLDRAAQNALTGARLLPLPDDYGPPRITMQVTFVYEAPRRS